MATERWYTLYTKPNAEYQVANALKQRGIQTYLPEIELAKPQQGRKKKPFFPCYLFIRVDFEAIGLSAVQWTPGLRRIVSFGDQPIPLPDDLITLVRHRLGEIKSAGGWPAHSFKPGDTVRITEGPLRNMLAIFEGPTTPSQRVKVLCSILGRLSRVQVEPELLTLAAAQVEAPAARRPRRTRGRGRRIRNGTDFVQPATVAVG